MTARSIHRLARARVNLHGSGLVTHDVSSDQLGEAINPFIFVSLYDMNAPTFPPHPHAGFSVATYILPESPIGFVNQDSLGHLNPIAPGSLHWTTAGAGVLHEEQPEHMGSVARGFQLWIDMANADRQTKPSALHLAAPEVPKFRGEGSMIRVVLGSSNGISSPLVVPTPVRLIDVALEPNAHFVQDLPHLENVFIFMLGGSAGINGTDAVEDNVISFNNEGDEVAIAAGGQGARFILFAGVPFDQTRVQRGPFVAGNEAELAEFIQNFSAGRFGELTPFAEKLSVIPVDYVRDR